MFKFVANDCSKQFASEKCFYDLTYTFGNNYHLPGDSSHIREVDAMQDK